MNRITNSYKHMRPFVTDGKESLKKLGFSLTKEDDQKATFTNSKGIIVEIVFQRYDPPEIWIGNINLRDRIRIDLFSEKYFNKTGEILRKYSNNKIKFDHSSFEYYQEFLISFMTEIEKTENIARSINYWNKDNQKNKKSL